MTGTKALVLSIFMAFSLLASGAIAQGSGDASRSCEQSGAPLSLDYERDSRAEWPREAQRIKRNEQLVSRQQGRLRFTLDGGKTIDLVDCPFGEGAHWYLYE